MVPGVYVILVILAQVALRMASIEMEVGYMKRSHLSAKFFIFAVLETVMSIQINVASGMLPLS